MEQGLKNFNKAISKKDNFIADSMDELQEIVNAKQLLPEKLLNVLFGDMDKEIEIEMEQRKKDKQAKKLNDEIIQEVTESQENKIEVDTAPKVVDI